jgi:hypothetical protein
MREQDLLLPPGLRGWLPGGHLAYFGGYVVEQLVLAGLGNPMILQREMQPRSSLTELGERRTYGARLPELPGRFKREFDVVIIDRTPMLQIPDTRVLGKVADAVVLVVRSRDHKRCSSNPAC